MEKQQAGTFIVNLGDLELSDEALARIDQSIRKSVLSEIASVDEAPTFRAARQPDLRRFGDDWWKQIDLGQTRGIWVDIEQVGFPG